MTQAQVNQSLAEIQALAAELVDIDDDMTEVVSGGGGGRKLPVGKSLARLVSYIEYGKQPQEYQGQAKDPAIEFRLGFALYGPGFANDDGTPYVIETFNMSKSRNEKAGAFLLFKMMNYKGTHKNFAQMVGEAFIVDIIDYVPKTAAPGTAPKSRLNTKLVLPPVDLLSGATYPVPAVNAADLHLFSWAKPTLSGWDKLYIAGTNDKNESKNWIQETIVGATDFAGSPLETLLLTNQRQIPVARTPKSRTKAAAAPVGAVPVGALPSAVPAAAVPVSAPAAGIAIAAPAASVAVPNVSVAQLGVAASPVVIPAAVGVQVPAVAGSPANLLAMAVPQ